MARFVARAGRFALGGLNLLLATLVSWVVFMLLPLLEQATRPAQGDLEVRPVGSVDLAPPPPPPSEEKAQEEAEETPPELSETAAPLDLGQLELALNPTFGDGPGDFAMRLPGAEGGTAVAEADVIFSAAELDQVPRPVSQFPPEYPADLRRKKISGTVHVVFVVDRTGRVVQPSVEQAPHPQLGAAAAAAVRKWRFEPGQRRGKPVPFKMRVPITFLNQ
jgi:TonB family protein